MNTDSIKKMQLSSEVLKVLKENDYNLEEISKATLNPQIAYLFNGTREEEDIKQRLELFKCLLFPYKTNNLIKDIESKFQLTILIIMFIFTIVFTIGFIKGGNFHCLRLKKPLTNKELNLELEENMIITIKQNNKEMNITNLNKSTIFLYTKPFNETILLIEKNHINLFYSLINDDDVEDSIETYNVLSFIFLLLLLLYFRY